MNQEQIKLFDMDAVKPENFCRSCIHRTAYRYTHTSISYCEMKGSSRTYNGKLKIQAKDPACHLHVKINKQKPGTGLTEHHSNETNK